MLTIGKTKGKYDLTKTFLLITVVYVRNSRKIETYNQTK